MTKRRKRKIPANDSLVSCRLGSGRVPNPNLDVGIEGKHTSDIEKENAVDVRMTEGPTLSENVVLELINSFKFNR